MKAVFAVEVADEDDVEMCINVLKETSLPFERVDTISLDLDVPAPARRPAMRLGDQTECELRVSRVDAYVEDTSQQVVYGMGGQHRGMVPGRDPTLKIELELEADAEPRLNALMQRISKFGRVILKAVG